MKNVNKWFFFNPLFVLYTDDKDFIHGLKDPKQKILYYYNPIQDVELDPFDYDERQMNLRESYKIESEMVNYQSAHRLREQFRKNQTFHYFLSDSLNYDFKKLPVALITFVLSVFLATDESLRHHFYSRYKGKTVPAITQWCLNTFRTSPISDGETVTSFHLIDDEYRATLFCCGLGGTFADKSYLKLYPEDMVAWFNVLEEHFSSDEQNYLEPVEFTRVPSISTEKNLLCGLTVENGAVTSRETSYFHQLADDKKNVYPLLARVLDSVCVPENMELAVPHKNLLERSFDEQVIVPQLIRFIVSECKTFLA